MNLNKMFNSLVLVSVLATAPLYPSSINTPKDIGDWMETNFTYQSEEVDYWKSPEETVKDKGGDCEDFSVLSKKILEDLEYTAWFITMDTKADKYIGHAICLFKEKDGTFSVFDNQYYLPTKFVHWKTLLEKYYSEYNNVWNCTPEGHCKKIYIIKS